MPDYSGNIFVTRACFDIKIMTLSLNDFSMKSKKLMRQTQPVTRGEGVRRFVSVLKLSAPLTSSSHMGYGDRGTGLLTRHSHTLRT